MKTRITVHSKYRYKVGPAASFTFSLAAREDLSAGLIRRIVAGLLLSYRDPTRFSLDPGLLDDGILFDAAIGW
jgi:hypothetical protein